MRSLIADAIRDRLSDPRIAPITSVTRVEVSEDLSVAHVYVSVLADDAHRKLCLTGLRSAAGLLRRVLAPDLHIRKIPVLEFRLDESLRQEAATLAIIDQAMRELGQVPEWEREDAEETEQEESSHPGEVAGEAPAPPPPSEEAN